MAECARLLSGYPPKGGSWVRIPFPPPVGPLITLQDRPSQKEAAMPRRTNHEGTFRRRGNSWQVGVQIAQALSCCLIIWTCS